MGDLLQKAMEGISGAMAPDPNNPFPVPPPSFMEYPLAFIGGLGQHPRAGPVTRGLGAVSGFAGQQMASRRTDPFARALAASQAGIEAAKGITVPVPGATIPGQTITPSSSVEPNDFPLTGGPIDLPEFQMPGTTRPVRTMTELLANARTPQDSRMINAATLMGVPEDRFFTKPTPLHFAAPGTVPTDPFTGKTVGDQIPAKPKIEFRMRPIQQPGESFATMQAEFKEVTNSLTGEVLSRTEVPETRSLIHPAQKAENPLDDQLKRQRLGAMKRTDEKIKRLDAGMLTPREADQEISRLKAQRESDMKFGSEEEVADDNARIQQLLPAASRLGGGPPSMPEVTPTEMMHSRYMQAGPKQTEGGWKKYLASEEGKKNLKAYMDYKQKQRNTSAMSGLPQGWHVVQ